MLKIMQSGATQALTTDGVVLSFRSARFIVAATEVEIKVIQENYQSISFIDIL